MDPVWYDSNFRAALFKWLPSTYKICTFVKLSRTRSWISARRLSLRSLQDMTVLQSYTRVQHFQMLSLTTKRKSCNYLLSARYDRIIKLCTSSCFWILSQLLISDAYIPHIGASVADVLIRSARPLELKCATHAQITTRFNVTAIVGKKNKLPIHLSFDK